MLSCFGSSELAVYGIESIGSVCRYDRVCSDNYNGACVMIDMNLSVGITLGRGAFAEVKAVYNHSMNRLMALKVMNKRLASDDYLSMFLPREIELLRVLSHRRVLAAHHIVETKDQVFILMDLAENGDLRDYIYKRNYLPEVEARYLFSQIAEGVRYLHSNCIAHRDLKSENILLDKNMDIKIADFGFAIDVLHSPATTACGSLAFVAPEVLRRNRDTDFYDALKADVWSMGVILFAMVTGQLVFGNDDEIKKTEVRLVRFPTDVELTDEIKCLIRAMLQRNVASRTSCDRVILHSWMMGPPAKKPPQPNKDSVRYNEHSVGLAHSIPDVKSTSTVTALNSITCTVVLLVLCVCAVLNYVHTALYILSL